MSLPKAGALNKVIFESPFQPKPFSYSMILMYLSNGFGQALPCDRSRSVGLPQVLVLGLCYRLGLIAGMLLFPSHVVDGYSAVVRRK